MPPFGGADLPFGERRLPRRHAASHVAVPADGRVRSDADPGDGFTAADAGFANVYCSTLAHARRAARRLP